VEFSKIEKDGFSKETKNGYIYQTIYIVLYHRIGYPTTLKIETFTAKEYISRILEE